MDDLDKCFEITTQKTICLKEQKTYFYIDNNLSQPIVKIQIDNCLIKEKKRCDWLLIISEVKTEVYIELKGSRVQDALKQLKDTLNNNDLKHILQKKLAYQKPLKKVCCIISLRCPLDKQEIENAKKSFGKNGVTLKFLSSNSDESKQKVSTLII